MALSTDQYGYLIDPLVPITDATGTTIKDGFLRVYVAGSSTPVITYKNFDGTANEKTIELDNSGRCKYPVIVSKSLAYKLAVYDAQHSQETPIITVNKMFAIGASVTVGAGATVVTGLDGFRTKPDGFVDASVIGTDGYVALDHTLVDDDLDTDAKATAVENDRYIPLLNNDVNDPDSKMTLKRLKLWVHNDNVVIAGTIYPTLQDAIADADNLSVGDVFETNGFHSNGDGGAARYFVSDTGTANGMDIVQLAAGKLAIVQLKGSAYTEQIGYEVSSAQTDVTPYIKRLLDLGVQNIKFYPTGGAPTKCYCIRDTLDLDRSDYHNVGVQLEGADIGQTSGYATWFNFQPSVSNTEKVAIKVRARTTRIKNIVLVYGDGASDLGVRDSSAAICFDSTGNTSYQTSSYGTVLENLTIQGFNTAILSMGTAPYIWHVDCEKITCSANNTHVSLDGLSYCTTFRNCLFNSPDVQSVYLGEPFTVKFDSCNFGVDDRGTCIIRAVKWVVDSAPVDEKRGLVLFQNCNMEVEYRSTSVPQNNKHLFIYADDNSLIDYEFDNCCFIYTPLTRENVTSDRMMSLGAGSSIIIRNSIGPYSDVNYTNNEFYGKDYDKYFFDESRPPEKKVGSLKLEHVVGIDPLVFLDSAHLPCLKRDDDVILYDNNTDLAQFKGLGDGAMLFNLDTFVPSVKVAGQLQACASAPSGIVRIGNELYDYVTIDGRKWITRNLNLRLVTRQHTIWDHLEWGQYYKYSDLSAIQSALPSGWRIPNAADVTSLIGGGTSARAHDLQSLGVSYWPSATNSTGFSALPSTWWYKPNTTPHSTFKKYAFYWTAVTEGSNVKNISIAPDAVSSGGWTAGEAASLWIPLRVCADA